MYFVVVPKNDYTIGDSSTRSSYQFTTIFVVGISLWEGDMFYDLQDPLFKFCLSKETRLPSTRLNDERKTEFLAIGGELRAHLGSGGASEAQERVISPHFFGPRGGKGLE